MRFARCFGATDGSEGKKHRRLSHCLLVPTSMLDHDSLQAMWREREDGAGPPCWRCTLPRLALSIRRTSYRWTCMKCGAESPSFHVRGGVVREEALPPGWIEGDTPQPGDAT